MMRLGLSVWRRKISDKVSFFSHRIHNTYYQRDSSLSMLTLITRLKHCLSDVSTIKLLFLPIFLDCALWKEVTVSSLTWGVGSFAPSQSMCFEWSLCAGLCYRCRNNHSKHGIKDPFPAWNFHLSEGLTVNERTNKQTNKPHLREVK